MTAIALALTLGAGLSGCAAAGGESARPVSLPASSVSATPTPTPTATPTPWCPDTPETMSDLTDQQRAGYHDGAVAFEAAAFEFPYALPGGYTWPPERNVTVMHVPNDDLDDVRLAVWEVWIGANARAALDGDTSAAHALQSTPLGVDSATIAQIRSLLDQEDYATITLMFPLPCGMHVSPRA